MKRIVPLYLVIAAALPLGVRAQYSLINQTLVLNGSSYQSVPHSAAFNADLNQYGMLSIDAWVKPSSVAGNQAIVGNDWTAGYYFGLTSGGKVRFYPRPGVSYDSPGSIPLNTWSHVAVSFNARKGDIRIYINGVLNGSTAVATGGIGAQTGGDLRIGADRQAGAPQYFFNGSIDEVRIWRSEINFATAAGLLYKVPHAVYNGLHGADLVAGWRLNGNADGIAAQHNGSLAGSGGAYSAASLPPHYTRIAALLTNVQPLTAAGTHDYFTIPHDASLSLTQNFTIECWVKPSPTNGTNTYQTFVSKSSLYMNQWSYWLGLNKANGKVRFVPNGVFADGLESSGALTTGQWTHIAARYQVAGNTRTATLFINGMPAGSKTFAANAGPNTLPVLIGRTDLPAMPGTGYGYSGSIDEVRIWNTARSDSEIANNYRLELDGPNAGLVASWHFDGDVVDASGTGNDGDHTLAASSIAYFVNSEDLPARPSITLVSPNGGDTWFIGTTRTVQWTASNLTNVKILLSSDGGVNYDKVIAASVPASAGSHSYFVTQPETDKARVFVTTTTLTGVGDESNADFTIAFPPPTLVATPPALVFAAPQAGALPAVQRVKLDNTGGGTLNWSASTGGAGWLNLTPSSGSANLDSVNVEILDTNLPEGSYNEIITFTGNFSNTPVQVPVTYRVTKKQIVSISGRVTYGGAPLPGIEIGVYGAISTTATTDGSGMYIAAGLPADSYTVIPTNPFYDFTPPSRSYPSLAASVTDAHFTAASKKGRAMLRWREGWNLISFPLIPDITDLNLLLPAALLPAYTYSAAEGYEETRSVQSGKLEMWIRFGSTDSAEVAGLLLPAVQKIVSSADGGWQLVGTPSGPVDVAAMQQSPAGTISSIYEYDPWLGYMPPLGGVLRPGRAYFMRAMGDGSVRIAATQMFAPWVPLPTLRFPGASVLPAMPPPPPSE